MGKIVHFGSLTIVNEIKSQGQSAKDVQLFSLVVQLFSLVVQLFNGCTAFQKYTYEDYRICTGLEKLHILEKLYTIVIEIKSQGQCTKNLQLFLWLYSFLIVVQLFKNIDMTTTEFVQVCKKMYISVQTPLSMKLRAKESVPEMYSFLFWLYSFLMVVQLFKNIHMRTIEFVQVWKTVHFGTNTIVNEYKSQGQCTKDVQLFSLVVQLFNGLYSFSEIHI